MALRVSGKNLDIGSALRSHVTERIDFTMAKYAVSSMTGHVTIEPEGSGFRTDCTLYLASGVTLQVEAEAHEPYASFNIAADRIDKRLRRHRRRIRDHHAANGIERQPPDGELTERFDAASEVGVQTSMFEDATVPANSNAMVIAERCASLPDMSVARAVLELDRLQAPVVAFRASDGHANIVYRRTDGNIGWIDMPPAKMADL